MEEHSSRGERSHENADGGKQVEKDPPSSNELSWIQNPSGIEGLLHSMVKISHLRRRRQRPPRFLRQADPMFSRDDTVQRQHAAEQFIERRMGASLGIWLRRVHHDVDMDIPVPGMAETSYGESVFLAQVDGELE